MKTLFIYALLPALFLSGTHNSAAAEPDSKKKAAITAESKKSADKKGPNVAKAKSAPASTHTLKKGLFEIKVDLSGVFAAIKTSAISLAPKKWNSLSVVSALAHGTEIKKGDVLLQLETKDLKKAIQKAKLAQPLATLSIKLAELELIELKESTPLKLASHQRSKLQSQEDLAYFEKTDLKHRSESAEQNLKQSSQYLSYAREELDQLEKMYAADDLTEETEEIIITRAKNSVASAQFRLDSIKVSTERTLTTLLPRERQSLQDHVKSSTIVWDKSSKSLPQALKKKQLELGKMKYEQQEAANHLAEMKTDLAAFTIKAPHDGIVYFGASKRGKWSSAALLEKKLSPGGKLMPHEIFMTVVRAEKLQVLSSVPESQLSLLEDGLTGKITPTSKPNSPLQGELSALSRIPLSSGGFPATIKLTGDSKDLYPGMTCKVLFEIYKNKNALTVPKKSVTTENGKSHVLLKNGSKQLVKTGRSNDKDIEILEGLKEGDTIKL